MPYTLLFNKDINCIVLTFEKSINVTLIQEVTPKVVSLCRETGCWRILNDMNGASIDMSMMHLFNYVDIIDKASPSGMARSALLFPSDFYDSHVLGSTARNRGSSLKVFFDIAEAKEWLLVNG
jgi:hypothetical protein